jgi:hypothetical protein
MSDLPCNLAVTGFSVFPRHPVRRCHVAWGRLQPTTLVQPGAMSVQRPGVSALSAVLLSLPLLASVPVWRRAAASVLLASSA